MMNGASMKGSASVALKGGRSTWEGLKTIQVAALVVAAAAAGTSSLGVDSAPLPPSFRLPNVAARSSEIHSGIVAQKSLLALITVRGWTRGPLATT